MNIKMVMFGRYLQHGGRVDKTTWRSFYPDLPFELRWDLRENLGMGSTVHETHLLMTTCRADYRIENVTNSPELEIYWKA